MDNVMTDSRKANSAAKENKGKRASLDLDCITPILTKGGRKKLTAAPTPRAAVLRPFRGGGRLQFCLFHSMRRAGQGLQNLLFFTFRRLRTIWYGLAHPPLDQRWEELVQLDDGDHRPGYDDLAPSLAISPIGRSRYSLSGDAANGLRTDVALAVGDNVRAEISAHIPGTNRQHVDIVPLQFNARTFADGIHRKFTGRVDGHERNGNVSGNAGDIHDGPAPCFAHGGRH